MLSFFEGDLYVIHLHYMHKKMLKGIQRFQKKKINRRIKFLKTILSLNLELSMNPSIWKSLKEDPIEFVIQVWFDGNISVNIQEKGFKFAFPKIWSSLAWEPISQGTMHVTGASPKMLGA